MNGFGKMIHAEGEVYEGNWVNGKSNGEGTYTQSNGTLYKGSWNNDQPNGFGIEV